ncbi:MAG TPA: transcription antitermination factor NusB [Xanthobacteraceae bacterium]|jgi:N utilization substance protein B|nr:transcription antitermination factor NusB [Xanthobacteraceae bacterium]
MAFDKTKERSAARLAAVQALYQMDIAATDLNDVLAEFEARFVREGVGEKFPHTESPFFRDIVEGVLREQRELDPKVDEILNATWPLKRIEAILRAVLRAGAYELSHRSDVPARVAISEYVSVAKSFLDQEETGMVNAVLDQLARQTRAAEFAAG